MRDLLRALTAADPRPGRRWPPSWRPWRTTRSARSTGRALRPRPPERRTRGRRTRGGEEPAPRGSRLRINLAGGAASAALPGPAPARTRARTRLGPGTGDGPSGDESPGDGPRRSGSVSTSRAARRTVPAVARTAVRTTDPPRAEEHGHEHEHREVPGNLQYAVDIVMCVDITGSMNPVLDAVKESSLQFHQRLGAIMASKSKEISQLRLKVIAFRDFGDNPANAIEQTDFLKLPEQSAEYERFVRGLRASGGGDIPESGLEALALAVNSPWETGLDRRRHVIVMFTDAPPTRSARWALPRRTIRSTFRAPWTRSSSSGDTRAARPPSWSSRPSASSSSRRRRSRGRTPSGRNGTSPCISSRAGEGLEEFEMDEIIETIANSL
ncbi:vWA domain-containing protein [Streptomyces sp. M19]